ncbi:MAG: glutamyl-tRNA amidotransferase [Clostridia bacterium]|nr:glutamyl-tRNA amidotransferase [Clostridia bacterium]MBQ8234143.1 glutamyl-tRNA amidotransferase [Bacilli bacterium]MBR1984277.1 glutamyl-tRNA amidotransferase [Clostridia bacterium]MBR4003304.1 glutamyl-tRNA amidotransferase [Clostridia bacterium]
MRKNNKLQLSSKGKKLFKMYVMGVSIFALTIGTSMNVLAADDPMAVVNNLSNFIFGLIRAIGMILLGFGIVQIGLSLKSHDPSQRANGFLTLAGGVIITFAKEILNMITG